MNVTMALFPSIFTHMETAYVKYEISLLEQEKASLIKPTVVQELTEIETVENELEETSEGEVNVSTTFC